jgi:hypothetical protein
LRILRSGVVEEIEIEERAIVERGTVCCGALLPPASRAPRHSGSHPRNENHRIHRSTQSRPSPPLFIEKAARLQLPVNQV